MGDKTKIDWCDSSWNPVTGCLHGCEYCYARRIAERFGGFGFSTNTEISKELAEGKIVYVPAALQHYRSDKNYEVTKAPYPFGFKPTFYRERLDIPKRWTRPRNIFVCSMADLFGEWVPDEWIKAVLDACRKAPQHRYLFLTKNPERYDALEDAGIIKEEDQNFWLGSTVTVETRDKFHYNSRMHTFQSCEPMLAPWPPARKPNPESMARGWMPEWVIFGAETGNRTGKVIPEKAWIDNAVQMCRNMGAAVFMKESLRGIMGDDFIQEFPWGNAMMRNDEQAEKLEFVSEGGYRGTLYNWHYDEWTGEWNYSMSVEDGRGTEVLHAYNAAPKTADELKRVVRMLAEEFGSAPDGRNKGDEDD